MPYLALATDYDGTIAHDGVVDDATIAALERFRTGSRKLILVTGRELDDLARVMPRLDLFDLVVAENGALLYVPSSREERPLAEPPQAAFAARLCSLGVNPLSVGRVIVATWQPNEAVVLAAIRDLGLDLQITFNKGAVMVLPAGVNKRSGLRAALAELEISPHNCVAVGDAENDLPFLDLCGCSAAVANALPSVRRAATLVTRGARGAGVAELIERMLATDLAETDADNPRQRVPLALPLDASADVPLDFNPQRQNLLLAGVSGGGKTTLTAGILERLAERGFQYCVIDPEGDYVEAETAISIGTAEEAPRLDMVRDLLRKSERGVAVNLLGLKLADRPGFFAGLLAELLLLRGRIGRPHLIVVDEAHHTLPEADDPGQALMPTDVSGFMFIAVRPESLSPRVVARTDRMIAVGPEAAAAVAAFCAAHRLPVPQLPQGVPTGEMLTLTVDDPAPRRLAVIPGKGTLRRHVRKYAEGNLGEDRSFFFRGPQARLNLRAANLTTFLDLADGVDDDTWQYHRQQHDYSSWVERSIKDRELAEEIAEVEAGDLPVGPARAAIRHAIERRYTKPA